MTATVASTSTPMRYLAYCDECHDGLHSTLAKAQKWADKHNEKVHPNA